MASTNYGAAITTQAPAVVAAGNIAQQYVLLITPGLTTSITATTSVEVTATVTGLQLSDFVMLNKQSHVAGLSIGNVRVSALNTLAIQMVNTTGSPIALLAADTYLLAIKRPVAQQVSNGLTATIPA